MLQGDKVVLRAIERDDLERLWEISNDPEVHSRVFEEPFTPQSFERLEAQYEDDAGQGGRDSAAFVIEAEDDVVGRCELFQFDAASRTCRIGLTIDREYWGRGYGKDAASTLVDYAFHHHNMRKVWLDVLADNDRAVALYKSLGFIEEGRLVEQSWSDGAYRDLIYMGLFKKDWHKG
jgi:diamine N-acetyltransferase